MEAVMVAMLQGREWPLALNILYNQGYTTEGILHLEKVHPIVLRSACKEQLLLAKMAEELEHKLMWG